MENKWTPEQIALLKEAIDLVKPLVEEIEAGPEVTRNRYGNYMSLLLEAPPGPQRKKLAVVLMLAGANQQGVADALKLC